LAAELRSVPAGGFMEHHFSARRPAIAMFGALPVRTT
jgi:hypothetical protein